MEIEKIQDKISSIVDEYKRIFPAEYRLAVEAVKKKRENMQTKFGEIKGNGIVERAIAEYPETLFTSLNLQLDSDSLAYFSSKKGIRWFANKYREYSLVVKI